uniref:Uncharacterized protein n=1 Tax=Amphimedon queenslandica TaxID=400682 RepID=A0A1X7UYD7_AMPQE
SSIEGVQYFVLKMVFKSWSSSYSDLLSKFSLTTLAQRCLRFKLITLFKIKENMLFSPSHPLIQSTPSHYSLRSNYQGNLKPINICKSSSFLHSFFPSSINQWNSLPSSIKLSLSIFKLKSFISSNLY